MKDFKVYQASGMLTELVKNASDVRKTEQTLTGDIVSFNSDEQSPLKIVVDIDSTGWTGATIYKRANSLGFPLDPTDKEVNACQITYIKSNGTVKEVKFLRNSGTTGGVNEVLFRAYAPITGIYYVKATGFIGSGDYHMYYNVGGVNTDTINGSFSFNATKGDNITVGVYVSSRKNIDIQFGFPILSSAPISEDYVIDQGVDIPISWQTEAGTITDGTLTIDYDGAVTLETGGQTYTLQSISPIETLIGDNNICADAGPVSVTYPI